MGVALEVSAEAFEVGIDAARAESKTEVVWDAPLEGVLDNQGCGTIACEGPLSRLVHYAADAKCATVRDVKAKFKDKDRF